MSIALMVLGFSHKPPHVAKNIIVGLDFDGTIAYDAHIRVWYAKKFYSKRITEQQILKETWPFDEDSYRKMADAVHTEYVDEHIVAPHCAEVLHRLYRQGFRFAVVTSRDTKMVWAAKGFISKRHLPIKFLHGTDSNPKDYLVKKLHARAFLDDSVYKLVPLVGSFVAPFYIRQPWNVHEPIPGNSSGITMVSDWLEFEKWLLHIKIMHEAVCFFNKWNNDFLHTAQIATFARTHPEETLRMVEEYKRTTALQPV
jgi:uncharacterized HAD superfamily protein